MTSQTLRALPEPHQKLWRSVCRHARKAVVDLVRRGVEHRRILAIVAAAETDAYEATWACFPMCIASLGDDPEDPLVAVIGMRRSGEPDDEEDPMVDYLDGLPKGCFGILIFDHAGWPVVSSCVLPPGAANEKTQEGLNISWSAS